MSESKAELKARIAELMEALKPFAEAADGNYDNEHEYKLYFGEEKGFASLFFEDALSTLTTTHLDKACEVYNKLMPGETPEETTVATPATMTAEEASKLSPLPELWTNTIGFGWQRVTSVQSFKTDGVSVFLIYHEGRPVINAGRDYPLHTARPATASATPADEYEALEEIATALGVKHDRNIDNILNQLPEMLEAVKKLQTENALLKDALAISAVAKVPPHSHVVPTARERQLENDVNKAIQQLAYLSDNYRFPTAEKMEGAIELVIHSLKEALAANIPF